MFHDSANAKFQSFPVRREYFVDENLIAHEDHRLFIIKTKLKNQVTIQRLFWFRLVQRFIIAQYQISQSIHLLNSSYSSISTSFSLLIGFNYYIVYIIFLLIILLFITFFSILFCVC